MNSRVEKEITGVSGEGGGRWRKTLESGAEIEIGDKSETDGLNEG